MSKRLSEKVQRYLDLKRQGKTFHEIAEMCQTTYRVVYAAIYYHISPAYRERIRQYQIKYQNTPKKLQKVIKEGKKLSAFTDSPYIDKLAADLGLRRVDVVAAIMKDATTWVTIHKSDFTQERKLHINRDIMMQNIRALIARRHSV